MAEGETAWSVARRQHGVVTRRQLLALGFSPRRIEHRLGRGRLHRLDRGVYAVGRRELTRQGRWMAAVLSCGSRAVLSHRSAAALWGFGSELPGTIEVTVPFPSPRRRPGVRVYRRPKLRATDVTVRDGIPVTGLVRTFIDLAYQMGAGELERAVNEADRLELIDPERLVAAIFEHPGERGVGTLRELLGARTFRLTDSELERRFLLLVREARLPLPLTRHRVNGFLVDFYWPDLGLVVETDGIRYHRTPAQQARDHLRDQAHTASGLANLRFTHAQVRFEAGHVRATLARTISGLQREEHLPDPAPHPAA